MALKGNLKDVGLNQLLNLIYLAHKTGALTIQRDAGSVAARLYFKEGKLRSKFNFLFGSLSPGL